MGLYRKELDFKVISIIKHRMNTDGKGVTTLVALLGCPLKCSYCLNKKVLNAGIYRNYSVDSLIDDVMSDYCYYMATGGGITFGGGESLLWAENILTFRERLREDIAVNVETSLNLCLTPKDEDTGILDRLLKAITLFIIDIKSTDPEIYRAYTGKSNENMLRNLQLIAQKGCQDKCHIRVPVIPGYKTNEKALEDKEYLLGLGFRDIEIFDYIIREND